MKLSPIQSQLLELLKARKAVGLPKIAEANARALGGLSEYEKACIIGAHIDGQHVNGIRLKGLTYRAWQALNNAGLVYTVKSRNACVFVAKD